MMLIYDLLNLNLTHSQYKAILRDCLFIGKVQFQLAYTEIVRRKGEFINFLMKI